MTNEKKATTVFESIVMASREEDGVESRGIRMSIDYVMPPIIENEADLRREIEVKVSGGMVFDHRND